MFSSKNIFLCLSLSTSNIYVFEWMQWKIFNVFHTNNKGHACHKNTEEAVARNDTLMRTENTIKNMEGLKSDFWSNGAVKTALWLVTSFHILWVSIDLTFPIQTKLTVLN